MLFGPNLERSFVSKLSKIDQARFNREFGRYPPSRETALRRKTLAPLFQIFTEALDQESLTRLLSSPILLDLDSDLDIQIHITPVQVHTLDFLSGLGFGQESCLYLLQGMDIREFIAAGGNFLMLAELWQIAFEWVPFARRNDMLRTPVAPELFLTKLCGEVAIRSGLRGEKAASAVDVFLRRNGWGVPSETLDAIAQTYDLSRERIRQIERRMLDCSSAASYLVPEIFSELLELNLSGAQIDPLTILNRTLENSGSSFAGWTISSLAQVFDFLGQPSLGVLLEEHCVPNKEELEEHQALAASLRKARNVFGVIKLTSVINVLTNVSYSKEHVLANIGTVYKKYWASGDYAVVSNRTDSNPMIFNQVSYQLWYGKSLHLDQVYEGVRRASVARNSNATLPPRSVLADLLSQSEFFEIDSNWFISGLSKPTETEGILHWLHQVIKEAPGSVISKSAVLRKGLIAGINVSSIGQYISQSPVIRQPKEKFLTLVGVNVRAEDLELAELIDKASYVENEPIVFAPQDTGDVNVKALFSTPFFTSGVLYLNALGVAFVGTPSTREIRCCEIFVSESKATLSQGTMWYGFASIRNHLIEEHQVQEGSYFCFRLTKFAVDFNVYD